MRFKSLRMPVEQEAGSMSLVASAGLMLAKELAPNLIGKLIGKKDNAAVEIVVDNVVNAAMDLAGVDTPEAARDMFHADPEVAKVAKQEATKIILAEINAETRRAEIAAEDRAGARDMYKQGAQRVQLGLVAASFVLALLTGGVLVYMNIVGIEPSAIVISLATMIYREALPQIYNFFFGSSLGSKTKDG